MHDRCIINLMLISKRLGLKDHLVESSNPLDVFKALLPSFSIQPTLRMINDPTLGIIGFIRGLVIRAKLFTGSKIKGILVSF